MALLLVAAGNADSPVQFEEHLIADQYGYAFGVAAADLDEDGDLDLTSVDIKGKNPSLASIFWHENDGAGGFTRHVIHDQEPAWFERHAIGDIDGDGHLDVAVVNNRDGQILWFSNPHRAKQQSNEPASNPIYSKWKRHVMTTECTRAYDVALADLDGDKDLDAVAAGYASSRITWYENPGPAGLDMPWKERLIVDHMSEARTACVADFNQDGRIDVLAAGVGAENIPLDAARIDHGSRIVWMENPGNPANMPWQAHEIEVAARAPIQGHPVDLDRDGDLDVVMAHGMRGPLLPPEMHEVNWYEDLDGKGNSWKRRSIGKLPYAFEAVAGDLDGDGDVDVAATAWAKGDQVVWFEHPADAGAPWSMHLIKQDYFAANQVILADLDKDGRLDVIATADDGSSRVRGANELRWWKNRSASP